MKGDAPEDVVNVFDDKHWCETNSGIENFRHSFNLFSNKIENLEVFALKLSIGFLSNETFSLFKDRTII